MSVKVMGLVWELDIPSNEKFVLLAYADHADHDGGSIWPAVASVARKTSYSERSVQQITRSLQAKGLLVDDGKGPKGTNKWRIPTAQGEVVPQETVQGLPPAESAPVQNETQGGAEATAEGVQPTAPEPSLTVIEPSTREGLSQSEHKQANAKVTAMIENASKPTYVNRDKIPDPYLAYADTYNALTGQEPTKRVLHDWLMTFSEWASEGIRPEHVRQAHKESLGRFTVLRPGSLTNMAAALKAKGRVPTDTVRDALRETRLLLEQRKQEKARAVPMPDEIRKRLEPFRKRIKHES